MDYSVAAGEPGVREETLAAGVADVVRFEGLALGIAAVELVVHDATTPVYLRFGDAVTVGDRAAYVAGPGRHFVGGGAHDSVAVISEEPATYSLSRA